MCVAGVGRGVAGMVEQWGQKRPRREGLAWGGRQLD